MQRRYLDLTSLVNYCARALTVFDIPLLSTVLPVMALRTLEQL